MINDSKQESTIIIAQTTEEATAETDQDPCIFCISETPPATRYKGDCSCHPPVHVECINAWHARNPKQCPICLKGQPHDIIIIHTNVYTPKYALIFATLCCAVICCGPFIMLGVIFSLMRSRPVQSISNNITYIP